MRVMRKPYMTPNQREDGSDLPKEEQRLVVGGLSGSKTRKRVYLEAI